MQKSLLRPACQLTLFLFSLLFLAAEGKGESGLESIVSMFEQSLGDDAYSTCKQPDSSFALRIETREGYAFPGDTIKLAVSFKSPPFMIWGFDLLMAYDTSLLSFQKAEPGPEFFTESGCAWEYFNFRGGDTPPCYSPDCLKGKVRVVGLAETNVCCAHPNCWYSEKIADLFYLVFVVKNSEHLYTTAPVQFYWRDCGDNMIAYFDEDDPNGKWYEKIAMAGRVYNGSELLIPQDTFPTLLGPLDSCFSSGFGFTHNYSIRKIIDLYNGGISVVGSTCPDFNIDIRGDVNLNGLAYEINDFILFAKYFLYGLSVFTINTAGQIYATDVNKDDESLKLDDWVQLGRIVFGDLPVDWIFDSSLQGSNFVQNNSGEKFIEYNGQHCVDIFWLNFFGEIIPNPFSPNGVVFHHFDGVHTRVLVLGLNGFESAGANLFHYSGVGQIVEAQAATFEGYDVPLTFYDLSTEIGENPASLPSTFTLHQNYPNPFNNRTVINFDLPRAENVVFEIINLLGQTVYRIENRYSAGSHSIPWNGIDNQGRPVTSGVYYYRLVAGNFLESKKMILLK